MNAFGFTFIPFLFSAFFVLLVLKLSNRLRLLDNPTARSSHIGVMPKGGGIGIVAGFLLSVFYQGCVFSGQSLFFLIIIVSITFLAVLGLIDDVCNISRRVRLIVQFAVATLSIGITYDVSFTGALTQNNIFSTFSLFMIVVGMVWWINLYNFMDGTDGYLAVGTITISLCYILLFSLTILDIDKDYYSYLVFILYALIFSVLGFLAFNWPPAKIFMGDCGSLPIGFLLFFIGYTAFINQFINLYAIIIPAGVYFIDATYTLFRRILSKENWIEPHNTHAYQQAVKYLHRTFLERHADVNMARTYSHRIVSGTVLLINLLWLLPAALAAQRWENYGVIVLVTAWVPIIILVVMFSRQTAYKASN